MTLRPRPKSEAGIWNGWSPNTRALGGGGVHLHLRDGDVEFPADRNKFLDYKRLWERMVWRLFLEYEQTGAALVSELLATVEM